MIDASFDRHSRSAAVSGIYQYDTGQRMRLRGLPSPEELLEKDGIYARLYAAQWTDFTEI